MRTLGSVLMAVLLLVAALDSPQPDRRHLPERVREKLSRPAPTPHDEPSTAYIFFHQKRLAETPDLDPRHEYERARRHMASMPLHSSRRELILRPLALGSSASGAAGVAERLHLDAWVSLGPGNIGGRTRALVIDPRKPKRMYAAGVSGGVWKSTNGGRRWRPVGDDLANIAVNALAFDPDNPDILYAGTGEGYFREEVRATELPLRGGGIFISRDRGESWNLVESTAGQRFQWVNDIVVSQHDSSRIYAATRAGILRSTNGGRRWKRILKPRVKGGFLDLAVRTDVDTDYLFASCGTLEPATG